jgi:amino acid adenylation domain-containing protein
MSATVLAAHGINTAKCVHELFEARVETAPEAVALLYRDRTLTFRELNQRANQLARHLAGLGMGPERLTAVLLDRSPDAAIALLAALKTGGGYVPLDPGFPPGRIRQILRDASPVAIVTATAFEDRVPDVGLPVVHLDRAAAELGARSGDNLGALSFPDAVAYLMYTSGSTGEPKAVVSTHRGIVNGLTDTPFGNNADTGVCALNSAMSVGFTVAQLFLPLLTGVPLRMVPEEDGKDVRRLADALTSGGVTSVGIVTPLLRQLLALPPSSLDRLRQLRTVAIGGAPLTRDLLDKFVEALPTTTLLDGYAASEAGGAILVSMHRAPSAPGRLALGFPFTNTTVRVLDVDLRPVAEGDIGEIYVGAPHLARGYWRPPSLTATRFVADPARPGARMFRTGDLGRVLAAGGIEYLGRADDQVKIRGYRVVLGEVERALHSHPHVREAAVAAHAGPQDVRLVGYVVPATSERDTASLRSHLASRLPDYMVPSAFIFLDALPVNAAGKLDRPALPAPEPVRPDLDRPYTAPRSALEGTIAQIWADALGLDRVGIHDDFLELGGDSLIATQIVARIWETLATEIPFEILFERPTVAALVEQFFPDAARGEQASV